MKVQDGIFICILAMILFGQCLSAVQNAKKGERYDLEFTRYHVVATVVAIGLLSSDVKPYAFVAYGSIFLLLIFCLCVYQLKQGRRDQFILLKRDFMKILLVFLAVLCFVFVVLPSIFMGT